MKDRLAFVFPGQGSQYVGMGKDLLEKVPEAARIFSLAEDLTGIPVKRLCLDGPMEELTQATNLQACLTTVDIICCMAARDLGLEASAVAGHSLGEYPALWAAGVLSLEDTFKLVHARGRLMEEAGEKNPGAMAAVIGISRERLAELVGPLAKKGILALANHNSPEQIVVTGEKDLVRDLCRDAKAIGARAIPLKLSGAYHSPLMKEAARLFSEVLAEVPFSQARVPFYSNVTADPESDPEKIKKLMERQICMPVRWYEIATNMDRDGISNFIELGPKKVLGRLIMKCLPKGRARVFQGETLQDLRECIRATSDL